MSILRILWSFLLALPALACAPSKLIPGGCELSSAAGVAVHYALAPESITVALQAKTPGYVAIAFAPTGQRAMYPADAVAGWAGGATTVVKAYQLNGYLPMEILPSGVVLSNVSVSQVNDVTTVQFTRRLKAGRFPIANVQDVTFNVAQGDHDGLTEHTQKATVRANLLTGSPRPDPPPVASNTTEAALALLLAISVALVFVSAC